MNSQNVGNAPLLMERSPDDPSQFIRRSDFYWRGDVYPITPEVALEVRNNQFDIVRACGVQVPEYRTQGLAMSDKGLLYAVETVEYIEGTELGQAMAHNAPINVNELNTHYRGLVKYMAHVYDKGGFYLSDLTRAHDQTLFGKRVSDSKPHLYCADTEPILEHLDKYNLERQRNKHYYRSLNILGGSIRLASTLGYDVSDAQQTYHDFRNAIPLSIFDK